MSFSWFVYSPLGAKKAQALEVRLRAAIDEVVASKPGLVKKGQEWGEITVGEDVPSADDVAELAEAYDRVVPEDVLDRLDECRSSLEVERNGMNDLDPLQVSILRWLMQEIGPCLVDWGDFQIVTSESVTADLANFPGAGPLGGVGDEEPATAEEPAKAATEEGLERSTETEAAIQTLSDDPFLQRRFLRTLEKYPEFVKGYVKMIEEKGAMADAAAAKELGVSVDKLEPQLEKLHGMATGLAGEAEEDE